MSSESAVLPSLELSLAQRALWFVHQLAPQSSANNGLFAARVRSPLSRERLARAAELLARRHPMLRATFHAAGEAAVQRIHPEPQVELTWISHAGSDVEALALARREAARPFALERAPAWRLAVISSAPRQHLLVLSIHHLIIDLTSIVPMVDELLALTRDEGAALEPLPASFGDYVRHEQELLSGERGAALRAGWRRELEGPLLDLELPTDFARPAAQTYEGSSVLVPLSPGLRPRVRALARSLGVTPFSVLLAAYQALLGRWCGQRSFFVGTPSPGQRALPGLERAIGCFINMLPVRAELEGRPSFEALVRRVGDRVAAARALQEVPFPVVVQDHVRQRDPRRPPLFQTLFSVQRTPVAELAPFFVRTAEPGRVTLHGFELEAAPLSQQEGQLELALEVVELGELEYAAELKFNTALLAPATAASMAAAYAALLDGALAAPATPFDELPWLGGEARARVLAAAAGPLSLPPEVGEGGEGGAVVAAGADGADDEADGGRGEAARVREGFLGGWLRQVRRRPGAIAVSMGQTAWTYRVLAERAHRVAAALRQRGVIGEQIVAIDARRGPEWMAAILGALLAGATYVTIDPEHPVARRLELVRAAGAVGVLTEEARLGELAEPHAAKGRWTMALDGAALDGAAPAVGGARGGLRGGDVAPPPPEALAYLVFTSGSTGAPKAALVEHRGMHHHLRVKRAELGLGAGDVLAQNAPPGFVIANWQTLAPLEVGGRVEIIEPRAAADPRALLERVEASRVTVLQLVPSLLRALLELLEATPAERRPALSTLRLVVPTGEALPRALAERWYALLPGVPLVNAYGCSECSDDVAHYRVPRPGEAEDGWAPPAIVPLGHAAPGMRLYLLDEQLAPVPEGALGDLWVSGPMVGRGYLGDAPRTAEVFRRDPFCGDGAARMYRTGDRARRLPSGALAYHGRRDHQLKIRGIRVELGELEAALAALPELAAAAVTAEPDERGEPVLVGHVVARGAAPGRDAVMQQLRQRLPAALVPAHYRFVAALPTNANGKLDRGALAAAAREVMASAARAQQAAAAAVAPEGGGDELVGAVAALWRELLGVAQLGDRDDFFVLGGHSLLAVRLLVRVRERFGVELPLSSVFELSTVAAMAEALRRAGASAAGAEGAGGAEGAEGSLASLASSSASAPFQACPDEALEPFPLTELQQAYWIGQADEAGGPAVAFLEHDLADVEPAELGRALDRLIARHPMLRAVVRGDGQQQVLADPGPYPLEVQDLRALPRERQEAELARSRAELASFTLEPERWPSLRLRLLRVDDGHLRVHLGFPLLLGDLQSFRVISRELGELLLHPERELPPLQVSYRDAVLYLAGPAQERERRRAEAYWRARLAELPPAPELPLAPASPGAPRSSAMRRFAATLPAPAWQAIRQRARALGLTPTALVATVYAEVLARFSAHPALTLNLLVQRRPAVHPQIDGVVGNFSSTTLLAIDTAGAASFAERVRRVQAQLWRDLEHAQVSGIQVVRELARARGDGRASAMPVVLASVLHLEPEELDGAGGADLLGPPLSTALRTPHVWIDHQAAQTREGLRYHWDILEGRFPDGLDAQLFGCYRLALERLAADDRWSDSPVALPEQELAARRRANATEAPLSEALLHTLVLERAAAQPSAPAVIGEERRLSYGELVARAGQLAAELRASGLRPGELVAVCMHKGWEQVVAVLGALLAGGAYLPVDAALPDERRARLLQLAEVERVVTQERLAAALSWPAGLRVLPVRGEPEPATAAPVRPLVARQPGDLAYVIYTSGSTGDPKGVMIDHRGAVNTVLDINRRFAVGPRDRVLALSSLSFDLSVYDVFGVLAAGGALVLPAAERVVEPAHWLRLVERERVTLWNSVPQLLQLFVEHVEQVARAGGAPARLASLRLALVSGDWVPLDLAPRLAELAPAARTVSLGGATEASIWSIYHPIERVDPSWTSIPYGRPLQNQRFAVLDEALRPRPVWVPGELYISGAGLALGYLGDRARTRERFITHPVSGERLYRTGDLGRYLPDGEIEFLGRVDAQVKLNGYRVELGEIDAHLARLPGMRAAAAGVHGPARGPRQLVGYLVPESSADGAGEDRPRPLPAELGEALRAQLARALPSYMVPSHFVLLPALPLSRNGKLDRGALPAPTAAAAVERTASPPQTALERELAALWSEVLGEPIADRRADFFRELGGNSFSAVRMLTRLAARHPPAVSLGQLAQGSSIADLAALLEARSGGAGTAGGALHLLRRGPGVPLVLFHPIGGSALGYRALAEAMAPRSIYGVQARGLGGEEPSRSIEEMAARYADELEAALPAGPVALGGWSMGGLLAHAVAARLERRGRPVSALLLLDPATPGRVAQVAQGALARWFLRDLIRSAAPEAASEASLEAAPEAAPEATPDAAPEFGAALAPELAGGAGGHEASPDDAALELLVAAAQRHGALDPRVGLAELRSLFTVFRAHQRAMEQHRPQTVHAAATLLTAAESDYRWDEAALRHWRALTGPLHHVVVPGDHHSALAARHRPALAAELDRALAEADRALTVLAAGGAR